MINRTLGCECGEDEGNAQLVQARDGGARTQAKSKVGRGGEKRETGRMLRLMYLIWAG